MALNIEMRELRPEDAGQVAAIHKVMKVQDNFGFLLCDYLQDEEFEPYLNRVAEYQSEATVPEGKVVSTFLVAVVDGKIAGRVSIRHTLNEFLALTGGHIGYAVVPEFRGQGVATFMLRYALDFCRELGIERAFISCRVTNSASRAVIEKCGGEFARIVEDHNKDGGSFRTYWISTGL
jgi:predicted acetyltransferase